MWRKLLPLLMILTLLLVAACGEQGGSGTGQGGGEATPAAGGEATPAAGGEATPAAGGEATPAAGGEATPGTGGGAQDGGQAELGKDTIKIGYMPWTDCEAAANIARVVLENEGYTVEMTSADAGVVYQALSTGQIDTMLCSWQPITHEDYIEQFKDEIKSAGVLMEGAKLGWVVPNYVDIKAIPDLKGKADMFGGEIVGIDPGAGLMRLSEKVMEEYELRDEYELIESSDATMTTALGNAVQSEKPIVVTGWAPHVMWAKFDVKWLEDPKGVLGEAEQVHTMVTKGLQEEAPRAYKVLSQMSISTDEMSKIMLEIVEGGDAKEVAQKYVDEHPDAVKEWTSQ